MKLYRLCIVSIFLMILAFSSAACTPPAEATRPAASVTTLPPTPGADEPDAEPDLQDLLAQYSCLPDAADGEWVQVVQVIDGDTISIERDGRVERVRYLGVNTPEMDEPLGPAGRTCNREMVEGRQVYLLKDTSETDQYGRLLRFIFTADGFVNERLLLEGCAVQVTYEPDVACVDLFAQAEAQAREAGLGVWQPAEVAGETSGGVQIREIFYDGIKENEPDEFVEIENVGDQAVDLHDWLLKDQGNHRFDFPSFTLQPGQVCRIYTNEDHPESCGFSFDQITSAVWNNGGDCAYLYTQDGALVDDYCY